MKNIHVLKTDKPTRLFTSDSVLILAGYPATTFKTGKNIYITNDEEIKEGDWYINTFVSEREQKPQTHTEKRHLINHQKDYRFHYCKKIILTTDQDLIKDGVQAIDDEFLKWFVENPSCEEVEVKLENYYASGALQPNLWQHKIIIPKEEPNYNMKQETIAEMERLEEEPKQETLEEDLINSSPQEVKALIRHYKGLYLNYKSIVDRQERSYSEEDMREAFIAGGNSQIEEDDAYGNDYLEYMEDWFEQYKKK